MNDSNSLEHQSSEKLETPEKVPSPPPPKDTTVDLVEKNDSDNESVEAASETKAYNDDNSSTDGAEATEEAEPVQENSEDKKSDTELEQDNSETVEEPQEDIVESNETPFNSITNSMIHITKSQILSSEQNAEECHEKPVFFTSTNTELIDSTYGKNYESQEQSETENSKSVESPKRTEMNSCVDLFDDVIMTKDLEDKITELSNSLITSVELRDAVENSDLTESCVDLGAEEPRPEEPSTEEPIAEESTKLAEEEVKEEVAGEYAPNTSMEIIDKKQCEEDYEKVEVESISTEVKETPKRKLEDEIYEKPLGGDSLLKKITQYGEELNGRDYRPSTGQMCTISYEACLKDSSTVVEKNDELSFILGDGDVISAIDLVVSLMAKNEKCEVVTEARHAYGSIGKKPDIQPNVTLTYQLHLKDFKDITELNLMEPVERLSLAEAKKLRGNFHFNRQDFHLAVNSYKKGLKYFDLQNLKDDDEKEDLAKFAELRKALLMNLALSDFKQNQYKKALTSLNEVLDIEGSHMKALYIKGKVLMHLGETQEAILSLTKAHELAKDNVEVKNELTKAQAKHKLQYEKEKKMYQKMMRGTSEEKEVKSNEQRSNNSASSILTYTVAGVIMAGATLGVAMLAKYKNLL